MSRWEKGFVGNARMIWGDSDLRPWEGVWKEEEGLEHIEHIEHIP